MYDFDPSFEDNPKEAEITRKKNVNYRWSKEPAA
jgi:hypothetical protein